MTEKFIYPINVMRITQYPNWDRGGIDFIEGEPVDPEEAAKYFKDISRTIDDDIILNLDANGIMKYLWADDGMILESVLDKVTSAFPAIEVINDKLYGTINMELNAPLTDSEVESLKYDFTIQMRDGYNDGMKGDPVSTPASDLYINYRVEENYFMIHKMSLIIVW